MINHFEPQDLLSMESREMTNEIISRLKSLIGGFTEHIDRLAIDGQWLGANALQLEAKAEFSDHWKIVGKEGKHIKAIQAIVRGIGLSNDFNARLILKDADPGESRRSIVREFDGKKILADIIGILGCFSVEFDCYFQEGASAANVTVSGDIVEQFSKLKAESDIDVAGAIRVLGTAIGRSAGRILEIEFM